MSRLTVIKPSKVNATTEQMMHEFEQRILASPPGICPVDMQLSFLKVCHAQTCGKCVPCRIGLGQLEHLLELVLDHKADEHTLELIEETAKNIQYSASCAIGFEAARMVLMGLAGFREDYISHVTNKQCTASFAQPIPCVNQCPAHVDIPGYIALVHDGRNEDAVSLIRKDNPFPTACAYVCEHPCEERCRRNMLDSSVNIRAVKRYAVDEARADKVKVPASAASTGKKVAVIGGGPSGLTAAYFLQLMGHQVTVYEQRKQLGGMLVYGIPNYRLPRTRLKEDIDAILSTGIKVKKNVSIGKDITFKQLKKDFDAIYISIGAHTSKPFDIKGASPSTITSAVDMLREIGDGKYPDLTGKRVVIIGGGNVAMDVARSAIRCHADTVSIVYRRRQKDMTASSAEIEGAIAEGIELLTLQAPVSIETDETGAVKALIVQPQMASTYDPNGRPRSINAKKESLRLECDLILSAIGQDPVTDAFQEAGLPIKRNLFLTDEGGALIDQAGIFSGGDCVLGPSTAINAIAAGRAAAANIDEYLGFNHEISTDLEIPQPVMNNKTPCGRIHLSMREAWSRKNDFEEIEQNMSCEEVLQESERCLRCDHFGCATFRGGREWAW